MSILSPQNTSIINVLAKTYPEKRRVKKVPFVELFNNRLQGVVSSGSDVARVYVSFFEVSTLDYYCSTNNNRPCGGLRGAPCKHLYSMLDEAILQYGCEAIAKYLQIPKISSSYDIAKRAGQQKKEQASMVFSRFLYYLRYVELESSHSPIPEMTWFT